MTAQIHALERRDLVVARTAGAQAAAKLSADALNEKPLERAVYILVGTRRENRVRRRPRRASHESPATMRAVSSCVSSPASPKRVSVRDRPGQVVVRVPPVEVS